jgi:hypothetical protein
MTISKKKVIKKQVSIKQVKEKTKPEYKPVFTIPIVTRKTVKIDANYYGIKQYLKNRLGVDLFRKLKENGKKVIDDNESLFEGKPKFNWANYYNEMNLVILDYWMKYCVWFDRVVNKHE